MRHPRSAQVITRILLSVGLAVMVAMPASGQVGDDPVGDEPPASGGGLEAFEVARGTANSRALEPGMFLPGQEKVPLITTAVDVSTRPLSAVGQAAPYRPDIVAHFVWGSIGGGGHGEEGALPAFPGLAHATYPQSPHEHTYDSSIQEGDPEAVQFTVTHSSARADETPSARGDLALADFRIAGAELGIGQAISVSRGEVLEDHIEVETVTVLTDVVVGPLEIGTLISTARAVSDGTPDGAVATGSVELLEAELDGTPVRLRNNELVLEGEKHETGGDELADGLSDAVAETGWEFFADDPEIEISEDGQHVLVRSRGLVGTYRNEEGVGDQYYGHVVRLGAADAQALAVPAEPVDPSADADFDDPFDTAPQQAGTTFESGDEASPAPVTSTQGQQPPPAPAATVEQAPASFEETEVEEPLAAGDDDAAPATEPDQQDADSADVLAGDLGEDAARQIGRLYEVMALLAVSGLGLVSVMQALLRRLLAT